MAAERSEHKSRVEQLQKDIANWHRNIHTLKEKAPHVKPKEKVEYDRQLDLLVTKLSHLKENLRELQQKDSAEVHVNKLIERSLKEMDNAFSSALSKIN